MHLNACLLCVYGAVCLVSPVSRRGAGTQPPPPGLTCPVPGRVLAQARLVRDYPASYTVLSFPRPGASLLHSVRGMVVAAHLPLPAETGLMLVGCEVAVEDRRCQTPIACKLVVAPSTITADAAQREEGILGTSGWAMVEQPMEAHSLIARLSEPWSGLAHIRSFSDYPRDGNGLDAHAVFSRFHFELDGRTAWVAPAVLPAAAVSSVDGPAAHYGSPDFSPWSSDSTVWQD